MRSSCVVREGVRLELAEENQGIEEDIKTSSSSSSSSSSSFFSASASDLERIPLSPGDFLRWLGQGAYTAVGVRRKQRHPSQRNHPHPALEHPALPFWSQHLRRLERSVRTLSKHQKWFLEEGKEEEEDCWDSTTSQLLESITAKDLDDAIQPSLVEALKGVWEDLDEVEGNDNEREVVMLTIALKPNLRKGKDGSATKPLTCYVLRCILPVTEKPVNLILKTFERNIPSAKDVCWARDRLPLERCLPHSFSEVLMVSTNGNILEGMRSNFFVIRKMQPEEKEEQQKQQQKQQKQQQRQQLQGSSKKADASDSSLFCLQTAPLEAGVLPGIIRAAVIDLARDSGIVSRIIEEAPKISDCGSWCEAFVTSGVKLIQPVRCIASLVCDHMNTDQHKIKDKGEAPVSRTRTSSPHPSHFEEVKMEKEFHHVPGDMTVSIRENLVNHIQHPSSF